MRTHSNALGPPQTNTTDKTHWGRGCRLARELQRFLFVRARRPLSWLANQLTNKLTTDAPGGGAKFRAPSSWAKGGALLARQTRGLVSVAVAAAAGTRPRRLKLRQLATFNLPLSKFFVLLIGRSVCAFANYKSTKLAHRFLRLCCSLVFAPTGTRNCVALAQLAQRNAIARWLISISIGAPRAGRVCDARTCCCASQTDMPDQRSERFESRWLACCC